MAPAACSRYRYDRWPQAIAIDRLLLCRNMPTRLKRCASDEKSLRCPGCSPLPPSAQSMRWAARWEQFVRSVGADPHRSTGAGQTLTSPWALDRAAALTRPIKTRAYNVTFVTYADGKPFTLTQRMLERTAPRRGADTVVSWTRRRVNETDWGQRHLWRFEQKYDAARWVWKPFLIWDALRRARPGDFVVYADSSRYFVKGLERSLLPLTNVLDADASGALGGSRLGGGALRTFGMLPGVRLPLRNNHSLVNLAHASKRRAPKPYTGECY